uniref:HDC02973 n=1 Tax=Drosophila melanogaster TaxID=7227 RepID=Q6IH97_DROME|nr:TPA_inf: HDC02973 [Drosophila melanogaster]
MNKHTQNKAFTKPLTINIMILMVMMMMVMMMVMQSNKGSSNTNNNSSSSNNNVKHKKVVTPHSQKSARLDRLDGHYCCCSRRCRSRCRSWRSSSSRGCCCWQRLYQT